ncbi:MAG: LytTR family DNA-binding domain-containing protein [Anaerocolumna sp.]
MDIVIVDNERNALNYLANILKECDNVTIQNTFTDSVEALIYLLKNKTDALFLDIEMPNINGMYLAEQILHVYPKTKICFVTAYNDFAVKAFEINAIDYILKPYLETRIADCIKKMSLSKANNDKIQSISDNYKYELDIICGFDDEDVVLLGFQDVYYIEVINRNIFIHTGDKTYRGNKTLNFYEDKLRNRSFFRTHKCYIVNLEKISRFKPRINYTYDMFFKDIKDIVPISRNKVKELKTYFSI